MKEMKYEIRQRSAWITSMENRDIASTLWRGAAV